MEIKIKKVGNEIGTVGWLAAGIADGSIKITEGRTKSQIVNNIECGAKHGLWLYWGDGKQMLCLALQNAYGLTPDDFADCYKYEIIEKNGDPVWSHGDMIGCTEACWDTIIEIAQGWIDHTTEQREKDKKVKITIKFEEAA
jgi:hypothetical protein